jgi:hypothetical protein
MNKVEIRKPFDLRFFPFFRVNQRVSAVSEFEKTNPMLK